MQGQQVRDAPETALRKPVTGLGGVLSDLLSVRVILGMAPPNIPAEPLLAADMSPVHAMHDIHIRLGVILTHNSSINNQPPTACNVPKLIGDRGKIGEDRLGHQGVSGLYLPAVSQESSSPSKECTLLTGPLVSKTQARQLTRPDTR